MPLHVADKRGLPYGGAWAAVCPWDGHRFVVAGGWNDLLQAVKLHCVEKNYPVPLDFETLVESWVCAASPGVCTEASPPVAGLPSRPHTLHYADVWRGLVVWARFALSGQDLVSAEEAQCRADICAKCPMNRNFTGASCAGCGQLERVVKRLIGERQVKGALFSCGICHCYLSVAVWLPLDIQCHGVSEEMRLQFAQMKEAVGCWKQCRA